MSDGEDADEDHEPAPGPDDDRETESGAGVEDILPPDAEAPDPDEESPEDVAAPMEGLAEAARERRHAEESDDLMDAFDEVEVDGVDDESLWEQLEDDGVESTVDEPRDSSERDVQVVEKREYCMRCQYFSAPPEVRCTHERGEISEVVDSERFEVVDCPILRGEEELENLRR